MASTNSHPDIELGDENNAVSLVQRSQERNPFTRCLLAMMFWRRLGGSLGRSKVKQEDARGGLQSKTLSSTWMRIMGGGRTALNESQSRIIAKGTLDSRHWWPRTTPSQLSDASAGFACGCSCSGRTSYPFWRRGWTPSTAKNPVRCSLDAAGWIETQSARP